MSRFFCVLIILMVVVFCGSCGDNMVLCNLDNVCLIINEWLYYVCVFCNVECCWGVFVYV